MLESIGKLIWLHLPLDNEGIEEFNPSDYLENTSADVLHSDVEQFKTEVLRTTKPGALFHVDSGLGETGTVFNPSYTIYGAKSSLAVRPIFLAMEQFALNCGFSNQASIRHYVTPIHPEEASTRPHRDEVKGFITDTPLAGTGVMQLRMVYALEPGTLVFKGETSTDHIDIRFKDLKNGGTEIEFHPEEFDPIESYFRIQTISDKEIANLERVAQLIPGMVLAMDRLQKPLHAADPTYRRMTIFSDVIELIPPEKTEKLSTQSASVPGFNLNFRRIVDPGSKGHATNNQL